MKLFNHSTVPSGHPFLLNKYTQWYYDIISNALSRTDNPDIYVEKHHIIPDCFYVKNRSKGRRPGFLDGQSNSPSNLVVLTAREHFVCHWLLTKMVTGTLVSKMECALAAFKRQSKGQLRLTTSAQYERVRKANQTSRPDYKRQKNTTHKWWTDGITQLFVSECPGPDYKQGRGKRFKTKMLFHNNGTSNPSFGKLWWTDGTNEVKSQLPPSPEYYRGRAPSIKAIMKLKVKERDITGANNPAAGLYWWTDGIQTVRARECPHQGWIRGTGSLHRSKCSNKRT